MLHALLVLLFFSYNWDPINLDSLFKLNGGTERMSHNDRLHSQSLCPFSYVMEVHNLCGLVGIRTDVNLLPIAAKT